MCQSFKGVSFSFRFFFGKDGLGFFRSFEQRKKNISSWGNETKGCSSHRERVQTPARTPPIVSHRKKTDTTKQTTQTITVIRSFFFFVLSKREKRERERERERVKK